MQVAVVNVLESTSDVDGSEINEDKCVYTCWSFWILDLKVTMNLVIKSGHTIVVGCFL